MSVLGHIIILLTCLTLREFSKHYQVLHSVRYINFISRILHDSLTTRLFSCSLAPLETAAISTIAPRRHCAALTVCVVDVISANAFLCRLGFVLAESVVVSLFRFRSAGKGRADVFPHFLAPLADEAVMMFKCSVSFSARALPLSGRGLAFFIAGTELSE